MEETKIKLRKFSKVFYIIVKIVFICCIVGLGLSAIALVWVGIASHPDGTIVLFGHFSFNSPGAAPV